MKLTTNTPFTSLFPGMRDQQRIKEFVEFWTAQTKNPEWLQAVLQTLHTHIPEGVSISTEEVSIPTEKQASPRDSVHAAPESQTEPSAEAREPDKIMRRKLRSWIRRSQSRYNWRVSYSSHVLRTRGDSGNLHSRDCQRMWSKSPSYHRIEQP